LLVKGDGVMDPNSTPGRAVEDAESEVAARHRPDCGDGLVPESLVAQLAGYDQADLAGLPADAVKGASGCGTPVAFSDLLPGETVIGLSSGAGLDLLLAARKVGPSGRIIGVDRDGVLLERARSNAAAAGFDNVEVRRGSSEELPVADGLADWVISNRVISRCKDKAKVFAEIHRVLKPGGRVRLADILAEGLPKYVRSGAPPGASCVAHAMSEQEFIAGLADAGLTDIRDGGRYVYEEAQLAAIVGYTGCGENTEPGAVDFAGEAVGGVWSAYFFARKPLGEQGEVCKRDEKKEESR
jgi:SAM-dependent methyltransferase